MIIVNPKETVSFKEKELSAFDCFILISGSLADEVNNLALFLETCSKDVIILCDINELDDVIRLRGQSLDNYHFTLSAFEESE